METPYDYSKEARAKRKYEANQSALCIAEADRTKLTESLAALRARSWDISAGKYSPQSNTNEWKGVIKRQKLLSNRIASERRRLAVVKAECERLTENLRIAAYRREIKARASQDGTKSP